MILRPHTLFLLALALLANSVSLAAAASTSGISCVADAPPLVKLAVREVRRYVYLRSGELLPISHEPSDPSDRIRLTVDPTLQPQQYRLKTAGGNLTISGGSEVAVLHGAYAFAEKLGVRFELSGDVIPDDRIPLAIPVLDETRQPAFELRGIQPFHDFQEGPDWWNADDYKACAAQVAKMKMNFIGLHSYPWFKEWRHVCPEPAVWIGLPEDVDAAGRVKFSYPASWANTVRPGPIANNSWGHLPGKTGDFSAGASRLFDRDDYGAEVMRGLTPWPKTPADCNTLFNRVGDSFKDAFGFTRKLGIKVCIGTETPLWIPDEVRAKLKAQGKNTDEPAVLRELCTGMLQRIQRAYPVDYFWLWTPERALDPAKTQADLRLIHEVAASMNVKTAVSGWGWLAHQFAAFDQSLPKDIAFSCINEGIGFAPVTGEFGKISNRDRWCIPWMEDDTNLTAPQLFAGRVRKDVGDARKMGCNGIMGIHWRTRVIAPSLDMLARSGWQPHEGGDSGALRDVIGSEGKVTPKVHPQRSLPVDDFYADWCQARFGAPVGAAAARIFARIDGRLPRPSCWALGGAYGQSAGPGIIGDADPRPWEVAAGDYAFVDEFAALRPQVRGPGNLDRFDYWLGQFQYLKAMGKLRCTRAAFDQATLRAEHDPSAIHAALQARRQLASDWHAMMTYLLETVGNPGEMGTVANLELHTRLAGGYLTNFDARLEKSLGKPLPADCAISGDYTGKPRLIVPTVRGSVAMGEKLTLNIIALAVQSPAVVTVRVRPLGKGDWQDIAATHIARGVYCATLPAATGDFEYHITARTQSAIPLVWPASAPAMSQSVVVME